MNLGDVCLLLKFCIIQAPDGVVLLSGKIIGRYPCRERLGVKEGGGKLNMET